MGILAAGVIRGYQMGVVGAKVITCTMRKLEPAHLEICALITVRVKVQNRFICDVAEGNDNLHLSE